MEMKHLRTIIFVVGVLFGIWIGYSSLHATDIAIAVSLLACAQITLDRKSVV